MTTRKNKSEVNLDDPKYRFEARVKRLMGQGLTRKDAEEVVETVILTKEQEDVD